MDSEIRIVEKNLTASELHEYFIENSGLFINTLFKRVDIGKYAEKLSRYAIQFCAYHGDELAGVLACYFNHPDKKIGYISTISVPERFQRRGIAKSLMEEAIKYARINEFRMIKLEANMSNLPAVKMYIKLGFKITERLEHSMFLELPVNFKNYK